MELLILGVLLALGVSLASSTDARASSGKPPPDGTPPDGTPPPGSPPGKTPDDGKTPPALDPNTYQYPPGLRIGFQVQDDDPHDPVEFGRMIARLVTGDETRGVELIAENPCVVPFDVPGVVKKTTLVTGNDLRVPESWKVFISSALKFTGGKPLPPYPSGAPFTKSVSTHPTCPGH